MTRPMHVDEIQEPFDLGSGPYFVVQEEDDVPERAVFYDEADARLFIEAASGAAEQSVPLDVDALWDQRDTIRGGIDCDPLLNNRDWEQAHTALDGLIARLLPSGPSEPARPAEPICSKCGEPVVPWRDHIHTARPADAALREALDRLVTTVEMMFAGAERDPAMKQARAALAASQPTAGGEEPDRSDLDVVAITHPDYEDDDLDEPQP